MARTMPETGDIFRVKIVRWGGKRNPDFYYRSPDRRQWLSDGSTTTEYVGPYKSLASARGQLSTLTRGRVWVRRPDGEWVDRYEQREDIASATIQRAQTAWEDVE